MPGDPAWPSLSQWDSFNAKVDGRLIKTVPIGSPCHYPVYNSTECAIVRDRWHNTGFHEASSSSVMDALFANQSCDPFTKPDEPCVIGTYVQYAVNVSKPNHVIDAVAFVKKHNIRFVVRNTGHDYMGKSTGAGALSIWMHHLQTREWTDHFSSSVYTGPAVKAYAGVTGEMLHADAGERGYAIVAGKCPTVGFAGGYIQGGGHSVLSSTYGLAADQALQFEVITTTGKFVRASATENEDLFWALSGGGGGTYGIVWSVTVKAHADMHVTLAQLSFQSTDVPYDTFWEAITTYQLNVPAYTDAGATALTFYNKTFFQVQTFYAPNQTEKEVQLLLEPFTNKLNSLGINFTSLITSYPNVRSADLADASAYGEILVSTDQFTSRLFPRSLYQSSRSIQDMLRVVRNIIDDGAVITEIAIRPTLSVAGHPDNAVLPAWRENERLITAMLPWDDHAPIKEMLVLSRKLTQVYGKAMHRLTPGSGTYLNEADPFEPDWQRSFYGKNYNRLLAIKDKWDPDQLLYGRTAVGGDRWISQSDGRLCQSQREL
ncbi:isoamyl alcohol oxidase [Crucibulum laeve]|uniref:Isoamyl alcohol oxidase n=1 Tax=Crucibulum laeve TaxID=68775 RepID=A0A5C3M5M7_9AGAR|nr:isoamyl alcohol oxidase [Crucibulum laeve]